MEREEGKMARRLKAPLKKEDIKDVRAGDPVLISGLIYTARDAAHKRLVEMLEKNQALPFPLEEAVIYYAGPTPAKPGQPIGSAGPTTSYRMDPYAPRLLDLGLSAMIGKGQRSDQVKEAIRRNGGVYLGAIGGAGALIAGTVKRAWIVAFEDLGPEAIRALEVEDFPATVVIDSQGNDLYEIGRKRYLDSLSL